MKKLLIIGARGFGRDVYNLALKCPGYKKDYEIMGFLDDSKNALDQFDIYPPIVDTVENYIVNEDDVFICALGDVQHKKKYTQMILNKNGVFISLIHPLAEVDPSAQIGIGCIVFPFACIGSGALICDHALVQIASVVGHDAKIGKYSRIDCHVVCAGGANIEDEVTVHTSAVINQKILVQKGANVGAGSFVIRTVKKKSTVYGNPAIKLI